MSTNIRLFSTCPPSAEYSRSEYLRRLTDVVGWSDALGLEGILVYTDNRLADAWIISQLILQRTKRLCPLVAVQPIYMHPYTAAKQVASLAFLHERRVYLNMVAGGFSNDLAVLDDKTPHDRRYDRLVEYTSIIQRLLSEPHPVTFEGEFYRLSKVKLMPAAPSQLIPEIMISGSSEAGLAAANALNAIPVKYPKPARDETVMQSGARTAVRVGIVARTTDEEAWSAAHARFPADRKGELAHQAAMKTSDSVWHKQLSDIAGGGAGEESSPYWLIPFQMYKTFCPYLVGSHRTVAAEISGYVRLGYTDFILDVPEGLKDLEHTMSAFQTALTQGECHARTS